jgi:cytochrome c2
MNRSLAILAANAVLFAASGAMAPAMAQSAGDAAKGKTLFTQQCALCHSASSGQEGQGPSLYGVIGRKAGSEPGFPAYTKSLKGSNITWGAASLDKFLSGPTTLVPGTAMPISLSSAQDRRNVIAYLASLKKGR